MQNKLGPRRSIIGGDAASNQEMVLLSIQFQTPCVWHSLMGASPSPCPSADNLSSYSIDSMAQAHGYGRLAYTCTVTSWLAVTGCAGQQIPQTISPFASKRAEYTILHPVSRAVRVRAEPQMGSMKPFKGARAAVDDCGCESIAFSPTNPASMFTRFYLSTSCVWPFTDCHPAMPAGAMRMLAKMTFSRHRGSCIFHFHRLI